MAQVQDMQQGSGSIAMWGRAAGDRLRAFAHLLWHAVIIAAICGFQVLVVVWKVLVALGGGDGND